MNRPYKILIFGASYGSLLATKLGLAGHSSYLICLPAEAELINAERAPRAKAEPAPVVERDLTDERCVGCGRRGVAGEFCGRCEHDMKSEGWS